MHGPPCNYGHFLVKAGPVRKEASRISLVQWSHFLLGKFRAVEPVVAGKGMNLSLVLKNIWRSSFRPFTWMWGNGQDVPCGANAAFASPSSYSLSFLSPPPLPFITQSFLLLFLCSFWSLLLSLWFLLLSLFLKIFMKVVFPLFSQCVDIQ